MLRAKRVIGQRGKFFFAFLCVSEHFESIETHFFFENVYERKVQNACERSEQDASVNMLRQTVTLATMIFSSKTVGNDIKQEAFRERRHLHVFDHSLY